MIVVTHDLGVVAEIADRVLVMYAGRIVEQAPLDPLFYDPLHPYTWGLLGSITRVDGARPRRLAAIGGAPPALVDMTAGCRFAPRCPYVHAACREESVLAARAGDPEHLDRCRLEPAVKRSLRVVDGRIGLDAEEHAIA
jgi:oligopeptide/dipeptide ABC transporter ATP-binding protein